MSFWKFAFYHLVCIVGICLILIGGFFSLALFSNGYIHIGIIGIITAIGGVIAYLYGAYRIRTIIVERGVRDGIKDEKTIQQEEEKNGN